MRKRIWRMSEGQFDNRRPRLEFSTDGIELSGLEGSTLQGEFEMHSTNGVPIRGMIYSSNPYVVCLTPQFDGVDVKIRFTAGGAGFHEGDSMDGKFTVVYNQGVAYLPFVMHYLPKLPQSPYGTVASLEEFALLAQNHWNDALQMFYTTEFEQLMKHTTKEQYLLYQGYSKAVRNNKNFEQFLVACGLKNPVTYEMESRRDEFFSISENQKEMVEITKNTWGYIEITVESDADFVSVEKEKITTDFFLGSVLQYNYYVHKDRLHGGLNYARISFDGNGIHREITVVATLGEIGTPSQVMAWERKKQIFQLTKAYEEYRLHRLTTGDWCSQSIQLIDALKNGEKQDIWLELMKAQMYISNNQRQEALWIISDMKKNITDKHSVNWAYLLYLCTLIEREESYVDRLTREIELIFREHPEDPRVFWFLLFLREEYMKNSSRKLKAVAQWMMEGYRSPYLYIEAYYILCQDPYLMNGLDSFITSILRWAVMHQGITPDLAMQFFQILPAETRFRREIYQIAKASYQVCPKEEYLSVFISYLLKGQAFGEEYFPWYQKGIEQELRITGLYEAYLMSLDNDSVEELPQMLTMYFQYHSTISYDKKALLYANIISNKHKHPQVYEQYLRTIELFAMEQMKLGRIDDNLAIIYQELLQMGIINDDVASGIASLVFVRKIICLPKGINRVLIYQEQLANPLVYPVVNQCAYVPVISDHYQLFLEDTRGCLTSSTEAYYMEELFHIEGYVDELQKSAPQEISYILYYLTCHQNAQQMETRDMHLIDTFIHSKEVSEAYKASLLPQFIEFLKNHTQEELLETYLMEQADIASLSAEILSYVIELLISRSHYERAYQLVKNHNELSVSLDSLLQLCHHMILDTDFLSDDFLISLCGYLMEQDQSTPITTSYLVTYYVGPDQDMVHLWHLGQKEDLVLGKLEERLIIQMLYEEQLHDDLPQVVDSYYEKKPNKMVMEAYLSYLSHRYLISKEQVPEHIFQYLHMFARRNERLNECCRLALMKHLAYTKELSPQEFQLLDQLVKEFLLKNVYFSFYKQLDHRLIVKYHLYDKIFIEYRGNPREQIMISYQVNQGRVQEEEMLEMYQGIFVKQFVLFYGDKLSYQLYGEDINGLPIASDQVDFTDVVENGKENRYDLLNQMQSAFMYEEEQQLLAAMERYQGLDSVTRQLFTTI